MHFVVSPSRDQMHLACAKVYVHIGSISTMQLESDMYGLL